MSDVVTSMDEMLKAGEEAQQASTDAIRATSKNLVAGFAIPDLDALSEGVPDERLQRPPSGEHEFVEINARGRAALQQVRGAAVPLPVLAPALVSGDGRQLEQFAGRRTKSATRSLWCCQPPRQQPPGRSVPLPRLRIP